LGNPLTISVLVPTRAAIEASASTTVPILVPRPPQVPKVRPSPIALLRQFAEARRSILPPSDPLLFHNFGAPSPFDNLFGANGERPSLYGTVTVADRERIFGKRISDLTLNRLPEGYLSLYVPLLGRQTLPADEDPVDVRHALRQLALRFSFVPEWGEYEEFPTRVEHSRTALTGNIEARPLLIASNTLFLPRIGVESNSYSGGRSYNYIQLDLGVQHYVTDRTAFGMNYIKSQVSGHSPFLWDTLDTSQELDLRGQVGDSHHIVNVVLRYDLNRGQLYSWNVTYGRVLHCLVPTINYDARSHNIGFGLNIQGLTF